MQFHSLSRLYRPPFLRHSYLNSPLFLLEASTQDVYLHDRRISSQFNRTLLKFDAPFWRLLLLASTAIKVCRSSCSKFSHRTPSMISFLVKVHHLINDGSGGCLILQSRNEKENPCLRRVCTRQKNHIKIP